MQTLVNTNLQIPSPLFEQIGELASARNVPLAAMIQEALELFVRQQKRATWLAEGKAAYDHYLATGLHLTNDEVVAWMDQIMAGEDVPMPPCHT